MARSNSQMQFDVSYVSRIMRKIHIFSAMPVLVLMVFFAITGIYLNHPDWKGGDVEKKQQTIALPKSLTDLPDWPTHYASHSLTLLHWLDVEHGVSGVDFEIDWDELDSLVILNLSGPNGSTLIEAFIEEGQAHVDTRRLSLIDMLNNVHRAKHVSGLWRVLSDISAICMVLFSISGFWLVLVNRMERKNANIALLLGSSLFVFIITLMH
ncbi:PepSY-associated TM helix domain-containing protein [Pseudoalteromonas spongiae]|uniref:PepSY-associated TM helix domain-containing protein n=1 Tax=Pseudoalteromonas spongiae TaxID=298657 RepID=UPI00110C1221|nr:PepSY-associated TM helix domain-containing protein [Pseudoalteromonas spongiae]TMO82985.1 hypothetical protein CWC15_17350 [Pseudoalteromonas spongiae]